MKLFEIAPITIGETDFKVQVTEDGHFLGTFEGEEIYTDTRAALEERLKARTRKKRIALSIPVTYVRHGELKHGVVTGIHGGSENYLIRFDGQKGADQLREYQVEGNLFPRFSAEEDAEWRQLRKALTEASKAEEVFLQKRKVSGAKLLIEIRRACEKD